MTDLSFINTVFFKRLYSKSKVINFNIPKCNSIPNFDKYILSNEEESESIEVSKKSGGGISNNFIIFYVLLLTLICNKYKNYLIK